ncbi:calcium-binding protein [Conexibacter stalactiti]|uniref:Calcium-binding protein n=1 Tax=Conexibacter stalactiti TaxID=1940611 RepID=A0ABU4HR83_9ACTN|nr:calcium-binding protein [Conexibacter stalactiti]MDW5595810.1 calcium-binding protein [Conexibacter stalactiti]MEC5036452.1 calcium-binding protein [Conexibacter stalactiti]
MRLHRPVIVLAAALALAATGAGSAQAAQLVREGSTLILRGAPGERNYFGVGDDQFTTTRIHFSDRGGYPITADPALGCESSSTGFGAFSDCPYAGITEVRLEGADGDDELDISWDELPTTIRYVFDGGPGRDDLEGPTWPVFGMTLLGGDGDDDIRGGQGDDQLDGGAGNDLVDGNDGNDGVFGGEGDDTVSGGRRLSTDVVDGGPGYDSSLADWYDQNAGDLPIVVTLDGVANDGRAGENDNVLGIEKIRTALIARLVAGADPVEFEIEKSMSGGSTLIGSPGNDRLAGYSGNDTIDGRGGRDAIAGYLGNDTIEARDGAADTIDCGDGVDTVYVDPIDVTSKCETVIGAGSPPPDVRPGDRNPPPRSDRRAPRARAACRVPAIRRGSTVAAARKALKRAKCASPKLKKVRSGVRRGRVVKVTPKARSRTRAAVTIWISRG